MKEFITPKEIAIKLYRIKPFWFEGKPRVYVIGNKNTFGVIRFWFPDVQVDIGVYLYDKQAIKNMAIKAIENFSIYISDWNNERLS